MFMNPGVAFARALVAAFTITHAITHATAHATAHASPIPGTIGSLGRCLGTFTLKEPRTPLAKPGAGTVSTLPPQGQRQRAMAALAADFNSRALDAYGWTVVNLHKGFATLEGDPSTLPMLYEIPGIQELRPARTIGPALDASRRLSRVDGILNWGPGPNTQGVNGKGVLVGFVDFGFETHHPAFLDSAGKTRFMAIWDPNAPTEKGAPYGMGAIRYGEDLPTDTGFALHDGDFHGTHVASCAAGSDAAYPYYGMAPKASLIGVNLSTPGSRNDLETNVINGIQWMFRVADSLRMPCVINLSLGNAHFGPHDGTSLFDRFLDTMAGPGRIIVGAAGNDGIKRLHASFDMAAGDTLGAFAGVPAYLDLWGEAGKPFKIQILLVDSASRDYTISSAYLSTGTPRSRPIFDTLDWANPRTGKTVRVAVSVYTERANPGNSRPHVELILKDVTGTAPADLEGLRAGFRLTGPGRVHAWNAAGTPFLSMGIERFREGDNEYSISEIGGTAKSILTVGAYVAREVYTDYKGVAHTNLVDQKTGELASWSSRGPTLDGRIKPDLIAPGRAIVGALTRAMIRLADWQYPWTIVWPDPDALTGRYLAAEGTSQSAPIVAGIAALLLEADPGLTGAQIKAYLTGTAYKDEFTGPLAAPNGNWGYGKVDASAALQKVRPTPVSALRIGGPAAPARRPVAARFFQGNLEVSGLEGEGAVVAGLADWRGRAVAGPMTLRDGRMAFTEPLRPGVYIATLRTARASYRLRLFRQ